MEQLISQMIEAAKKDKRLLISLKNTAVKGQQFELAVQLRELETSLFPESEEQKQAKDVGDKTRLVLQMVELNVPDDVSWLISATLKKYFKMGGKFSIREASELIAKRKQLFSNDDAQ